MKFFFTFRKVGTIFRHGAFFYQIKKPFFAERYKQWKI